MDWITALQNRVHKIFGRLLDNNEVHVVYFEHERKGIKKSYQLKTNLFLHKPPTVFMKSMPMFYFFNSIPIYSYINQLIRSYDIEIIVTTNFLFAPLAIRAARKNSIPIVFDVVDFQPYHINYITFLPAIIKKIGNSLLTSILNFNIKHADYVITTGLPLSWYVKQIGIQNSKIISNGVDVNLFNSTHEKTSIQNKYNITSPIICFLGAMEYWIDYDKLFQALSHLIKQYPTLRCLFIGPSRHYGLTRIKQVAAKYNVLKSIVFTGRVPYKQLPSYICASDVCILPFTKNYLTHCVVPMKLLEYLACERPVVSIPLAGVKSIAQNNIFYADNPDEISNKIHYILSNKQKVQEMVIKGRNLSKKYNWTHLAQEYEKILSQTRSQFISKS